MRRGRQGVLTLGLVLALLLLLAPAALADSAKMPESLAVYARGLPEQQVQVIVQKTCLTADAEAVVRSLDGEVLSPLPIINAFVARVRAGHLGELVAAPSVRWVSPDALVTSSGSRYPSYWGSNYGSTSGTPTRNTYLSTLEIQQLWNAGLRGDGIGVAVIDSGVDSSKDFNSLWRAAFDGPDPDRVASNPTDDYGHGTHVAGIIAGNGANYYDGKYSGIAPNVNLYSLKIADDQGQTTESDVVAAMQWVYNNHDKYNLRVVNLSVNSGVDQSYHTSPLDAACEILWFHGVVVVASAGNGVAGAYTTLSAAPANDPFIITVGASDERGTTDYGDDVMVGFSAYGVTSDGFRKPDIVAPGRNIYSVLSNGSNWDNLYPDRVTGNGYYFRLSGTSMAAPMVTGTVALLLQDEPNLTPDQVKYRLLNTAHSIRAADGTSYKYLNSDRAVFASTTGSSNTGTAASQLLFSGSDPVMWNSVMWHSVMWNSVMWNSVMWNSVMWNSLDWSSIMWN